MRSVSPGPGHETVCHKVMINRVTGNSTDTCRPTCSKCCVCAVRVYLVVGGRDRTADRTAAAREGLGLWRRGAAAAGRRVVVPGVVLVHDPGRRQISVRPLKPFFFSFFLLDPRS